MKILFITPTPPNDLNRIRSKNIIIAMRDNGADVTLISLYKNEKEYKDLLKMEGICKRIIPIYQPHWLSLIQCCFGLISLWPLRNAYCFSFFMRKELKKIDKDQFDMIYIKRLRMAQYADIFDKQNSKVFIDVTDSMTKYYENLMKVAKGFSKLLAIEEYYKIKRYEAKICSIFQNIIICSEEDKKYINKKFGLNTRNITVLENGIDSKYRRYKEYKNIECGNRTKLVFWGVMNVETNNLSVKDFLKNYFIHLPEQYTMTVIGPKPSKDLLKYSSERIIFKGFIEDIYSELVNYDIFVNPIVSGAGVKNKVIQAGAFGLPIVSSILGADGIMSDIQKDIFLYRDVKGFLEQIENVQRIQKDKLIKILKNTSDNIIKYYDSFSILRLFIKKICKR